MKAQKVSRTWRAYELWRTWVKTQSGKMGSEAPTDRLPGSFGEYVMRGCNNVRSN